jgi:hypothetical protein
MDGVSFVVPVRNGAIGLADTLASIAAQGDGRPMELIVVDDRSTDGTRDVLSAFTARTRLTVRMIEADGRGAAAALNAGVRAARFPIICQVDQDVVLEPGWMPRLLSALDDPRVAAAQGYYRADSRAGLYARVMGLDLEQRYAAIEGHDTDHVCTGNTAYRASALREVGLFDPSLGYGYDNDLSYRLRRAGYRLVLCRDARSVHRWREGPVGYLGQQYGFGYGRIDIVAKHPGRVSGDAVSPWPMMLHAPATAVAVALYVVALVATAIGVSGALPATGATTILLVLAIERLVAGICAARRFHTRLPLLFPLLHLGRDLAWTAAIVVWICRRLTRRPASPSHSMMTRTDSTW